MDEPTDEQIKANVDERQLSLGLKFPHRFRKKCLYSEQLKQWVAEKEQAYKAKHEQTQTANETGSCLPKLKQLGQYRWVARLTAILTVSFLILAFIAAENPTFRSNVFKPLLTLLFYLVLFASLIAALIVAMGFTTRCPKCKKWWASEPAGVNEVDRNSGFETVTRYDTTRDRDGNVISKTDRKEQVHVTRILTRHNYRCTSCQHRWATFSTSTIEE